MLEEILEPQYKMGPDSPYLEVYIDYTEWTEYKELLPENQKMFERAVEAIMKTPLITAEEIKLHEGITTHNIGGMGLLRRAAGVDIDAERQRAKEERLYELQAKAVRRALCLGVDDITMNDLKVVGLFPVIVSLYSGSFNAFREYLKQNEFDSNGYPITKDDVSG